MQKAKAVESDLVSSGQPSVTEPLSISKIETSLPPLHGENAAFDVYVAARTDYQAELDRFYNGNNHSFKRHKWYAKVARAQEFSRLADGLLRMVGGSIGAKRKDEDKVVIGVGLGRFESKFRLASLDRSFMSYFVRK
ncbi:hypothetical protein BGW38_009947, partial [Lunasporangiospora selenospora]